MRVSAAGVGRRLGALVVDSVVLALLATPATIAGGSLGGAYSQGFLATDAGFAVSVAVAVLGALALWSMKGTAMGSPGYRVAKVRAVDALSGAPVGPARAVGRMVLASVIPLVALSVLFDGKRRGWHDKICRSVVVDISQLEAPFAVAGIGADAVRHVLGDVVDTDPVPVVAAAPAEPDAPASARASVASPAPAPAESPAAPVAKADLKEPTLHVEEDRDLTVWKDPTLPVAQLKWDDGTVSVIDGPAHVGRNPDLVEGYDTIPVADTTRSLSRSHISVETDINSILVADLGSTNGTDVIYANGDVVRLEPFRPARVRSGDVLRFADRSCTVTLL